MASLRTTILRALPRLASASRVGASATRVPAARLSATATATATVGMRGYKSKNSPQPLRDVMTGEIIGLPDIDVSEVRSTCTRIGLSSYALGSGWVHTRRDVESNHRRGKHCYLTHKNTVLIG